VTPLPVLLLDERATLPERAHAGDAGLDLVSIESVVLSPGARARVRTGIAIELPPGHAGLVVPRSGLAARDGVTVLNAPGLVDAGYRGEVQVILVNTDRERTFRVEPGDRIAQLVVVPVVTPAPVPAAALSETTRGEGGFGSTGRRAP
jgi:dUTP pyrophosphatase